MIYWDHNSTTPCAPEVVEAMQPYWNEEYGNPSSAHRMGRKADFALKKARGQVAALINALPHEIIFTSGATESNNLLFLGILLTLHTESKRVVVSSIEHKSILEPASLLEKHGFEIIKLPVDSTGVIKVKDAQTLITSDTLLVSVQAANNELGTIQPIEELAGLSHERGAYFHTDAVQVLGKIPFDVQKVNCDFASFSAHKIYGPKGIGALFVRGGVKRWPWERPFRGGGQESGLRPGTSNVPSIVGFGKASELILSHLTKSSIYIRDLVLKFTSELNLTYPEAKIINNISTSVPGTLSIILPNIPSDLILTHCKNICISKSSACNGAVGTSHVLEEVLKNDPLKDSVIRITFGHHSNTNDFFKFFDIIKNLINRDQHE